MYQYFVKFYIIPTRIIKIWFYFCMSCYLWSTLLMYLEENLSSSAWCFVATIFQHFASAIHSICFVWLIICLKVVIIPLNWEDMTSVIYLIAAWWRDIQPKTLSGITSTPYCCNPLSFVWSLVHTGGHFSRIFRIGWDNQLDSVYNKSKQWRFIYRFN